MDLELDLEPGLVETTLNAALELERMAQGKAEEAPAFGRVLAHLRGTQPLHHDDGGLVMLSDVRGIAMMRRAAHSAEVMTETDRENLKRIIAQFLDKLERLVTPGDTDGIRRAKTFCLSLNRELLRRENEQMTSRRPRHQQAA